MTRHRPLEEERCIFLLADTSQVLCCYGRRFSLWLDNGAVIAMSPDAAEFLPAEKLPYDPGANQSTSDFHVALFTGDGVEHISISGEGIIECDRGVKGHGPKPIALRAACMST